MVAAGSAVMVAAAADEASRPVDWPGVATDAAGGSNGAGSSPGAAAISSFAGATNHADNSSV
jgi:hypothetical protein